MTTVVPSSRLSFVTSPRNVLALSSSSDDVGSSASINSGLLTVALMAATRCCSPWLISRG